MDTPEQPTCGKGLAENSVLPARLGQLLAAMAETLAVHMKSLDLTDQNSRTEYDAYEGLVTEFQEIAASLDATAKQMAGYRDLPMGRHHQTAMTHPRVHATFETFVKQKRELLALFEKTTERDDQLLEVMRLHSP